ncbi:hypothetical protein F5Y16DRAFT_381711 [Xylariaceae sp. FL0255]|nr:hypothetical protein F5Y16DRAFT_381711 [Xylariaceae sp. FL0255]
MADEIDRLILAPFREIVEKGKIAIENVEVVGDSAPPAMLKAAQNLVKEGEKALKKIEPISTANYEEYGSNFVDAIKEHDEIAKYCEDLGELLWDFDDYVTVDEFDADKYDELQKASRKAAPKIWDILKRMKLVSPRPVSISLPNLGSDTGGPPSVGSTGITHASHELLTNNRLSDALGTGSVRDSETLGDFGPPRSPLPSKSIIRSNSAYSQPSEPPSEPPPSPPTTNPWQVGKAPRPRTIEEGDWERRPPVAPDSPTIPSAQLVTPIDGPSSPSDAKKWMQSMSEEHERRLRAASQSRGAPSDGSLSPLQSHRWTSSTQNSVDSVRPPTIRTPNQRPRPNRVPSQTGERSAPHPPPYHPTSARPGSSASHSLGVSPGADFSDHFTNPPGYPPRSTSVFDVVESLNATGTATSVRQSTTLHTPASHVPPAHIAQAHGIPRYPGPPPLYQTPAVPPRRPSGVTIRSQSSGRTAHPTFTNLSMDEGLIPVEIEESLNEYAIMARDPDCTITTSASYYKMKGFCKGAEEARKGQLGFRRIKRPVGGFSTAIVAKCSHCMFELDFKSVEQDLNNDSTASYTSNTVRFRLRMLQKSHLPIRIVEEQMYACVFCIQQGHTTEESDATVFFNQKSLFSHMARHPRPLPQISGFTIVEDPEVPIHIKDNFDLHFPQPPLESVMEGIAQEIARLPSAIATDTRKAQGSTRLPPDRQPVLHFASGARIVGIEFPAKYEGKWAIGWHDGVRAAFEADAVLIDGPPKSEVKMQATSTIQATARWKWNQKGGDERWLRFDKGDTIKNVSWIFTDHWCWSGTTSKGASGIFPQSHIDPSSVRSMTAADAASVSSGDKKNILKFSIRGRTNTDR